MRDFPGVVLRHSGVQIIGDSDVEMLRVLLALQDVDVFHGEVRLRKKLRRDSLRRALLYVHSVSSDAGLPSRSPPRRAKAGGPGLT